MNILLRLLDLKGDKICEMTEMSLNQYLRTDLINECIEEHGINSLFVEVNNERNKWLLLDNERQNVQ